MQAVCTIIVTDEDEPSEESSEPSEESSEESSEPSEEPSGVTSEPTKEASEEPSEPSEELSRQPSEPTGIEQSETQAIDTSDVPVRTGDENMIPTVVMMLILASGCIVICLRIRRKN